MDKPTCPHEHTVDQLIQRGNHAARRGSTASVISAQQLASDAIATCQSECGTASPFRDIQFQPISDKDAAALLEPCDPIGDAIRTSCDVVSKAWRDVRTFLRQPPKS